MRDLLKVFFGIILGVIILTLAIWVYRKTLYHNEPILRQPILVDCGCVNSQTKEFDSNLIKEMEHRLTLIEKRFDDFLIFQGVIITILLAMGLGVYFKAQHEIKSYFHEHFSIFKTDLTKLKDEALVLLSQIKTSATVIEELKLKAEESKKDKPSASDQKNTNT